MNLLSHNALETQLVQHKGNKILLLKLKSVIFVIKNSLSNGVCHSAICSIQELFFFKKCDVCLELLVSSKKHWSKIKIIRPNCFWKTGQKINIERHTVLCFNFGLKICKDTVPVGITGVDSKIKGSVIHKSNLV